MAAVACCLVLAAPANADPLDSYACLQISGANLNLSTAMTPQDARQPADIMEKYNPPDSVKQAIEHFVAVAPNQWSDPAYDQTNQTIKNWVNQVCPATGRS
jgi:hypothetical protein